MTEQLALVPAPPKPLTAKQQAVLDAVTRAGTEGLTTVEAGAILHSLKEESRWAHTPQERCRFCSQDGAAYLRRLRALGHVKYRSVLKVWVPADSTQPLSEELPRGMTDRIPY